VVEGRETGKWERGGKGNWKVGEGKETR